MIISLPKSSASGSGVRHINLRHDARQVLRLLDVAFGSALDPENRRSLQRSLTLMGQGWYPTVQTFPRSFSPGFVWEEDNQIVGNVSLMRSQDTHRFLVANVAVHPNWRRRGIARGMMAETIDYVRWFGGHTVLLQVKQDNDGARWLYNSLGFKTVGAMTHWYATPADIRGMPASPSPPVRPLQRHEWKDAYELDTSSVHPDLNWPDPLPLTAYKTGLWQWIDNFFNSRQVEHWATSNNNNQLTGVASIYSQWNRSHAVSIRVAPTYQGQLERQLLAKITRRLPYLAHRRLRLDHPADDSLMNQILAEIGFRAKRTLVTMRLDLT
jgi:ribosomal protein S18 acetylase RimI-like enzyme